MLAAVVLSSQFTGPSTLIYIQIVGALGAATCLAWMLLYCINLNARFPDFFPVLVSTVARNGLEVTAIAEGH